MTTYFFANRTDLDTEVGISAARWWDARSFAYMLFGDDTIETTINGKLRLCEDDAGAKYELQWVGNAVRSSSDLTLQVRKRKVDGKWGTWRKL